MNALRKTIAFIAVVAGAVAAGSAQSVFPTRVDLDSAVEKALSQNPQTKIAETGIRIAEFGLAEARNGKKPFVQFSQNAVLSNNPVFVFGSRLEQGRFRANSFALEALNDPAAFVNLRSTVYAEQPIFDRRQTRMRTALADVSRRQAEFGAESVRQQLRFEVVRGYFSAVLAREMVRVGSDALKSAEANSKKAKDMAEVGMTTDADFLAAEVEAANAGQMKLEAESGLVTATAALNITLGQKPELDIELTDDLVERFFPVESRDDLIRIAFENRPDWRRAELAIEAARAKTAGVRDQKRPEVKAFGSLGYSSPYIANGSTDYTVGVSLTYTLFDAGRKARIEQAATAETLAEAERDALADRIRIEVIRAEQGFRTARAKIQVSVKAIAQAEEVLRIVHDRYKFGLTTFNEVLRAESALVRARHNLLGARYEYYISYASVLLATGRLTGVADF